ncbi:MAG: hypothetical protein ACOYUZ_03740 [Patescibacteria group bacterium]
MQNPFTLTKDQDEMADTSNKVGQLAGKLGFVPTSGSVALPGDDVYSHIYETLEKVMATPEYKELARKRQAGEITQEQALQAVVEIAKQFDSE